MKRKKAAALGYEFGDVAPRVLARGRGLWAEALCRIASENDIPVIESGPLADSLAGLDPYDAVPEQYWIAVAEILKFVYETRGSDELHTSRRS